MPALSFMRLLRDTLWFGLALGLLPVLDKLGMKGSLPSGDMILLGGVVLGCTQTVESLTSRAQVERTGDQDSSLYARVESTALGQTALAVLAASVILGGLHAGKGLLLRHEVQALAVLVCFALLRSCFIIATGYWRIFPSLASRVLLLGGGEKVQALRELLDATEGRYSVRAVVPCALNPSHEHELQSVFGFDSGGLCDLALREKVNTIAVCLTERRGVIPVDALLQCRMHGIEVLDGPTLYERVARRLSIENITAGWLVFAGGFRISWFRRALKRIMDITLSLLGIILLLPFLPLIALLIRLDTPGPVFFRQTRVGYGGQEFEIYKFRTMRDRAEQSTGAVWAGVNDSRITRVGHFLRRSRIDELPQLLNILRGEMSIVGPRPERPEFVTSLVRELPFYAERHSVRPGLTGWAQVRYRYGASREDALEKLRYDLYYIKNQSVMLDVEIIIRTICVVTLGKGAR